MIPYVWAVLAGVVATGLELGYRAHVAWWPNFWWIAPGGLVVTYCIYRLLNTEFGWLPSIVLFSAVTTFMRIGMSFFVLHEPITVPNVVGAGVLVGGVVVKLVWK